MSLPPPNPPLAAAILFWRAFATFLSINLILTFCTQFQLFAFNFNFLHCLALIGVLSTNELAEFVHVFYY